MYAVNGNFVRDVMVDGAWLMREARLLTIEYPAARRALDSANAELRRRIAAKEQA